MKARRFSGMQTAPVAISPGSAPALPAVFVLAPGMYSWRGAAFDMTAGGRYLLVDTGGETAQRIVHDGWPTSADLLASSFCWSRAYGLAHDALPVAELNLQAQRGKVSLGCSKAIEWAFSWFRAAGVTCRIVRALTAQTPNGFTDGHVLLETNSGNGWVVHDISRGLRYPTGTGRSLRDKVLAGAAYTPEAIAGRAYDVAPAPADQFDSMAFFETEDYTEADQAATTARWLGIPAVDEDDLIWFGCPPGTESRASWVLSLSPMFRVLDWAQWQSRFYG